MSAQYFFSAALFPAEFPEPAAAAAVALLLAFAAIAGWASSATTDKDATANFEKFFIFVPPSNSEDYVRRVHVTYVASECWVNNETHQINACSCVTAIGMPNR
jgi:hypothetical protein